MLSSNAYLIIECRKSISLHWYSQMAFLRTRYVLVFFFFSYTYFESHTNTNNKTMLMLVVIDGKHPGCDEYYFGRREFSFTLENDVYLRYKSFKSVSSLEHAIKSCFPYKIDIGAVYSVDVSSPFFFFSCVLLVTIFYLSFLLLLQPDKRHAYSQTGTNVFTPVERELVFDIVSFLNFLL